MYLVSFYSRFGPPCWCDQVKDIGLFMSDSFTFTFEKLLKQIYILMCFFLSVLFFKSWVWFECHREPVSINVTKRRLLFWWGCLSSLLVLCGLASRGRSALAVHYGPLESTWFLFYFWTLCICTIVSIYKKLKLKHVNVYPRFDGKAVCKEKDASSFSLDSCSGLCSSRWCKNVGN